MSSTIDQGARYLESHEWVRVEGDGAVIGVSDYAQHQLSDVVYADLPEVGDTLTAGESMGTLESVKAAEEIYAPVSGEVVAVNEAIVDHPELVNSDPFGQGWLVKVKMSDPDELTRLMDATAYAEFIEKDAH